MIVSEKKLKWFASDISLYGYGNTVESEKMLFMPVGDTTRSHFRREFKRLHGVTPDAKEEATNRVILEGYLGASRSPGANPGAWPHWRLQKLLVLSKLWK